MLQLYTHTDIIHMTQDNCLTAEYTYQVLALIYRTAWERLAKIYMLKYDQLSRHSAVTIEGAGTI